MWYNRGVMFEDFQEKYTSVDYDYEDVREQSGYLPISVARKRAAKRLGQFIADAMSDKEILNFVEGN